jgi:spectrin beta
MDARYPRCETAVIKVGQQLVAVQHPDKKNIGARISKLQDTWARLRDLAAKRRTHLEDASESHQVTVLSLHGGFIILVPLPQYYADANEAESWIREKMPLVCSEDYGRDEGTAKVRKTLRSVLVPRFFVQNLTVRHGRLEEEIKAFETDLKRLDNLATLMTKASSAHKVGWKSSA